MRMKLTFSQGHDKSFKATKLMATHSSMTKLVLQQPVIPLDRPKSPNYKKDEVLTFKLQTNPDNNSLPIYKITIPYFKDGVAEVLFNFLWNMEEVITGQNATDPASKYALMCQLLQGDTLACFNQSALKPVEENNKNFYLCGNNFIMHVLPVHTLSKQKHYMWQHLCKPHHIKV